MGTSRFFDLRLLVVAVIAVATVGVIRQVSKRAEPAAVEHEFQKSLLDLPFVEEFDFELHDDLASTLHDDAAGMLSEELAETRSSESHEDRASDVPGSATDDDARPRSQADKNSKSTLVPGAAETDAGEHVEEVERRTDAQQSVDRTEPLTPWKPSRETRHYAALHDEIIAIDKKIKLLFHLKPVNLKSEKKRFAKDYDYNPQFEYRKLKFDAHALNEKLRHLDAQLDETLLAELLRGKIQEIVKKIALLQSIGTEGFPARSEALYGVPSRELKSAAVERLNAKPFRFPSTGETYDFKAAVREFEAVLDEYELESWRIKVKSKMVADCVAGKRNALFVREGAKFSAVRMRMLVAHEIETHLMTAENGKHQQLQLFNRGWANYLETQEGLAIYNQERAVPHDVEKNYRAATLVLVVDFAIKHTFSETFHYCRSLGMGFDKAFQTSVKVKRGIADTSRIGAFTKDLVYFSGYLQVTGFVSEGGDLRDLYLGKYNLRDLERVKQVSSLAQPVVLPEFLRVPN